MGGDAVNENTSRIEAGTARSEVGSTNHAGEAPQDVSRSHL